MKKKIMVAVVLVIALLFVSCGSKGEKLAEKHYKITIKAHEGDEAATEKLFGFPDEISVLNEKELQEYQAKMTELVQE